MKKKFKKGEKKKKKKRDYSRRRASKRKTFDEPASAAVGRGHAEAFGVVLVREETRGLDGLFHTVRFACHFASFAPRAPKGPSWRFSVLTRGISSFQRVGNTLGTFGPRSSRSVQGFSRTRSTAVPDTSLSVSRKVCASRAFPRLSRRRLSCVEVDEGVVDEVVVHARHGLDGLDALRRPRHVVPRLVSDSRSTVRERSRVSRRSGFRRVWSMVETVYRVRTINSLNESHVSSGIPEHSIDRPNRTGNDRDRRKQCHAATARDRAAARS